MRYGQFPQPHRERRGLGQIGLLGDRPEHGQVAGAPEVAADEVTAPGGQLGKQRVDARAATAG